MNIEDRQVVTFHYTLTDQAGEQRASSREAEPMTYLQGARNISPGRAQAMWGTSTGVRCVGSVEAAA